VSPWTFGGAEPYFYFLIVSGVGAGLVLWAGRILLEWKFNFVNCSVFWWLAILIGIAAWQIVPLPRNVIAAISPNTTAYYDRLLPSEPETLKPDAEPDSSFAQAGRTFSFYTWVTTRALVELVVVLALFALVQNNVASIGFLRRLSFLAILNATALSVFAIIQFFSSKQDQIYWKYTIVSGQVFGPFVCRNHFPFYVDIVVGLSLGLLFSVISVATSNRSKSPEKFGGRPGKGALLQRIRQSFLRTLQLVFSHPAFLWISFSVTIMFAAIVLSSSRGGLLSISVSFLLLLVFRSRILPGVSGLPTLLVVAAVGATAFFAWLGPGRIDRHIAERWSGAVLADRLPLWRAAWPLVGEFPIIGTGYGTFQFAEPLHRDSESESLRRFTFEHAHNEYLEAVVEGGLLRLIASLAAIVAVFRLGFKNVQALTRQRDKYLVIGAMFAFTTVVVHSAGEFGLHLPAIVILTTVVTAVLSAPLVPVPVAASKVRRFRALVAMLPAVSAGILVLTGLGIARDSYRRYVGQYYRSGAVFAARAGAPVERQIKLLETVVQLSPTSAEAQEELGQKYIEAYDTALDAVDSVARVRAVASLWLLPAKYQGFSSFLAMSSQNAGLSVHEQLGRVRSEAELTRLYLEPAIQSFMTARNLCPLLIRPHLRIAAHRTEIASAEPQEAYLARAKWIADSEPEVWYTSGLFELAKGNDQQAWLEFHESLKRSARFLPDILAHAKAHLDADEVLTLILPVDPELYLSAASILFPDPTDDKRRDFLAKSLTRLKDLSNKLTTMGWMAKAHILLSIDKPADAVLAYREALSLDPSRTHCRMELAELLLSLNRTEEARRELIPLLTHEPSQMKAKALFESSLRSRTPGRDVR
jgi:O-antigen ligase/tetratricopeptide (TPR) repeat protein